MKDLSALFDIRESRATSMGVALLMPKTLVVNRVATMIGSQKRISVKWNRVLLSLQNEIDHKPIQRELRSR